MANPASQGMIVSVEDTVRVELIVIRLVCE